MRRTRTRASSNAGRRVIVRRSRRYAPARHVGSWKLALADFMTALMALFLVLWLLATSTPEELKDISEYFSTPLLVAMAGGDRPTASNSAIPGGGPDPIYLDGETQHFEMPMTLRPQQAPRDFQRLRERITSVMELDKDLQQLREQLRFTLTPEGLAIQLLDTEQRPMFRRGSDEVEPYMSKLLRSIAPLLNELPNALAISGHTDSHPYPGQAHGYSNWELSTDRANASRRELMAGGLTQEKLKRVSGMADQVPLPGVTPDDALNRRIELLVMNGVEQRAVPMPRYVLPPVAGVPGATTSVVGRPAPSSVLPAAEAALSVEAEGQQPPAQQ
jgi:chemotaxis protein MotB